MKTIMVSYDLMVDESPQAYEKIISAIKTLGQVDKVQYSTWILATNLTCEYVRDYLVKYIHSRDSLMVTEIKAFASHGVQEKATSLIKRVWGEPVIKHVLGLTSFKSDLRKKLSR